jgi:thioredoxin 1
MSILFLCVASSAPTPGPTRPRRLWLLALVVVLVAAGIAVSAYRRARQPHEQVPLGAGRVQLLEFGMGVCEQCKLMRPVMAEAEREFGARIDVRTLDIREQANEELADKFGMRVIPFVVLVDGQGKELWRHEGFMPFSALSEAVGPRIGLLGKQ